MWGLPRARLGAVGALLVVLLAVGVEAALAPSPAVSLEAMAVLGPFDGWRCVHELTYVYEPRWPRLGGGLLAEAPETALHDVEVDRVEVNLRTGEAVLWARVGRDQQRVYVLAPGRLQAVGTSCAGHLAEWQVIGEHSIG